MARTKPASEFEFPAPILQGRTAGTENKFKNFCLFTTLWKFFKDIGPLCKKQKLRVQTCDWSKNSAWCVNFENQFFFTNHIVALSANNLSFFICRIETNSSLVGLFFYIMRLSIDHKKIFQLLNKTLGGKFKFWCQIGPYHKSTNLGHLICTYTRFDDFFAIPHSGLKSVLENNSPNSRFVY